MVEEDYIIKAIMKRKPKFATLSDKDKKKVIHSVANVWKEETGDLTLEEGNVVVLRISLMDLYRDYDELMSGGV